jgi:hypothetical protein
MTYIVARIRPSFGETREYWTGLHVGPGRECNPVVSLRLDDARRWPSASDADAAIERYDPRMKAQHFEVLPLDREEWGE